MEPKRGERVEGRRGGERVEGRRGGERVEGRRGGERVEGRRGGGEDRKNRHHTVQSKLLLVCKTCQHVLPLPTSLLNTIHDRSRKDSEK